MIKYPRTQHLQGSRLQAGDHDLAQVPFADVRGLHLVVEEKVDGANAGLSFTEQGTPMLQSRGHVLVGGRRERHFALLKAWASVHRGPLFERLGTRYVLYGEWLYAKHTMFYDMLPHYLLEFDVLDRRQGVFLDTPRRGQLLEGLPVRSVPVLYSGQVQRLDALTALLGPSLFKSTGWRASLEAAADAGENAQWGSVERAVSETDPSDLAEGLYIKVEHDGQVVQRLKWVRRSFFDAVQGSDGHWLDRPIVANQLALGVELFP